MKQTKQSGQFRTVISDVAEAADDGTKTMELDPQRSKIDAGNTGFN